MLIRPLSQNLHGNLTEEACSSRVRGRKIYLLKYFPCNYRVLYPEKLTHKIEADSQQKLVMRFLLRDGGSKKPMRTHQAFVRLSSASDSNSDEKSREILFVAEPDTFNLYKFDMVIYYLEPSPLPPRGKLLVCEIPLQPVGSAAANFDYQSGDYNVELIVGDAILSNPFQWTVATVSLKFPESTSVERTDKPVSHKHKFNVYMTKPEIKVIIITTLDVYCPPTTRKQKPMLVSDSNAFAILSPP